MAILGHKDLEVWQNNTKDFMRFLMIARGSAAELETQLIISHDLDYTSEENVMPLLESTKEIGRMLSGLLSKLEQKS